MSIEIVVDELVLRGVPSERAGEVAAALGARLTVLGGESARSGARLAPREEASRRAPDVEARPSAAALGDAVAGAVWHAVEGGRP
jgi:hypothetical protein